MLGLVRAVHCNSNSGYSAAAHSKVGILLQSCRLQVRAARLFMDPYSNNNLNIANGLRRSHRQTLDPLSAVKPAKRGAVLLMRRLGEVGSPLPLATSAEQAVENFFREPPPHHVDALHDMFPILMNKSKSSPFMGWSVD